MRSQILRSLVQRSNIRISAQNPMNYIERYKITKEKLQQQLIEPVISTLRVDQYESWLLKRAGYLAQDGNEFLKSLKSPQ